MLQAREASTARKKANSPVPSPPQGTHATWCTGQNGLAARTAHMSIGCITVGSTTTLWNIGADA